MIIKKLGLKKWKETNKKMEIFINKAKKTTKDEIWILEHYSTYVLGKTQKQIKKKYIKNIPVYKSDRGGKITYHGPGQKIFYILLNIKKKNIYIKQLINIIHNTIIKTLKTYNINAYTKKKSPGIYIKKHKVCFIGIKIKNGYSMHGFSINISTNLKYFNYINPCGNKKIKITNLNKFKTFQKIKKYIYLNNLIIKNFIFFYNN